LLSECQTTGGYPRIGSVLPSDIPLIAQAGAGSEIRFRFVTIDEAMQAEREALESRQALPEQCRAMLRNPRDIDDLLSYQLISGVVSGDV
jgi:allophanate hydrolase